jgi:hypothetical protein
MSNRVIRRISMAALAMAIVFCFVLAFAASPQNQELSIFNNRVKEIITVQEAVTPGLMSSAEILGTAVGQDDDGEISLVVYVNMESPRLAQTVRMLPKTILGARVLIEITEPFVAMAAHTAKQAPPIQLGTSGGWGYDLANGYCCGGTLGSLVKIGADQYILSNYHVFAADIVNGGNGRVAAIGDPIIQPGLIDVQCNLANAQTVATLSKWFSPNNSSVNVDTALAKVVPGMVRTDGAILEIGTISASTVAASIGQAVKKSGRTTGLTTSTVAGINGTVSVTYDNECAGGTAFTKTYVRQILIRNPRSRFLAGGDSGSLLVENKTTNPRAIGLLFAGSSTTAVANAIGEVLKQYGASMVGK